MTGRGGQHERRAAPPRVDRAAWFAAIDAAGPGASAAELAAILSCVPDSVRRYRRRFAVREPDRAGPPPDSRTGTRTARTEPPPEPSEPVRIGPVRRAANSEPGRVVFGVRADGAPLAGPLGFVLFAGQRGAGKSTALASAAEHVAGQVVVVDMHGHAPGSVTELLGLDPAHVATTQAEAIDRIAAVHAELLARLSGQSAARTPLLLLIDEYAALAHPSNSSLELAAEQVLAIGLQGRKVEIGAWVGTQRPAGPGSGISRSLRDGVDGRVVLRLDGDDARYASGRPVRQLPADPSTFAPGEALVQVPGGTGLVLARIPLPSRAGAAPSASPALPVVDAELQQLASARELHHVQGDALETLAAALGGIQRSDGAGHLRRALDQAARLVARASTPGAVRKIVAVYAADIDTARAQAVQAEQLRRLRRVPEPVDFEPEDQDQDQDAPELAEWTSRPSFGPGPGLLALGSMVAMAAAGTGRRPRRPAPAAPSAEPGPEHWRDRVPGAVPRRRWR